MPLPEENKVDLFKGERQSTPGIKKVALALFVTWLLLIIANDQFLGPFVRHGPYDQQVRWLAYLSYLALGIVAWWFPRIGGAILIALGALEGGGVILMSFNRITLIHWIPVASTIIVSLLPISAGILFICSYKPKK